MKSNLKNNPQWGLEHTLLTAMSILSQIVVVALAIEGLCPPNLAIISLLALLGSSWMVLGGTFFEYRFYNALAFQLATNAHADRTIREDNRLDKLDNFMIDTFFLQQQKDAADKLLKAAETRKRREKEAASQTYTADWRRPWITQRR